VCHEMHFGSFLAHSRVKLGLVGAVVTVCGSLFRQFMIIAVKIRIENASH
jgi:hypothetical protein